jgi:hypothetical protein
MADRPKIQVTTSELAEFIQQESQLARERGELKAFLIKKGLAANVAEYVTTTWGAYTANDLQHVTLQDLDNLKKNSNDRDLPEEASGGEATENHYLSRLPPAAGGPDPLTEMDGWMDGREACDSDRRVTVNNIQVILVCGRPGAAAPAGTPAAKGVKAQSARPVF